MNKVKNIKRITVALILFIGLISCVKIEEIKVGDIKEVNIAGIHGNIINLKLTVPIENPNSFNLQIKDADLKVLSGDREIGKVKQIDNLLILSKSSQDYTLNIAIEITNLKDIMSSAMIMFSGGFHDLHLTGTVMASSYLYSKRIKIENYSLAK